MRRDASPKDRRHDGGRRQGSGRERGAAGNAGAADLLNIARFGDGEKGATDASAAEGHLLKAARCAMELAGFHPDEEERGKLYRAISNYVSTLGDE
jgi:hypothetical protein